MPVTLVQHTGMPVLRERAHVAKKVRADPRYFAGYPFLATHLALYYASPPTDGD
jgi:hypothetical protein